MMNQQNKNSLAVLLVSLLFILLLYMRVVNISFGVQGDAMLDNGLSIYKAIVSAEVQSELYPDDLKMVFPHEFKNSTEYFSWLFSKDVIADVPSLFRAPNVPEIETVKELSTESNPWSVGYMQDEKKQENISYPFLISRNINESFFHTCFDNNQSCELKNLGSRSGNGFIYPFDVHTLVVVFNDGSGNILQENRLRWNNVNIDNIQGVIISP